MTTLTISANSLGIYDRCHRAYLHYKVQGRRAVRSQAGLIAGTAIHEGLRLLNEGKPMAEQDEAVNATLLETPTPADDYRQAAYLRDALAAFRAEFSNTFAGWTTLEVESQGAVELGQVTHRIPGAEYPDADKRIVQVLWEFRRDLVAQAPDGLIYVFDYKTASRNEEVEYKAMHNSGQFMGYCVSWNLQHPGTPAAGVQPVRIILRKPTKNGTAFEFPKDAAILFPQDRLDEWRRHTLRKVRELLERDPNEPDDWPLACNTLGGCRHQFGACDFLPVCTMPPGDRATRLAMDDFELTSSSDKPALPNGSEEP